MTQPRRIRKGSTYLITRRCSQRAFLLSPREWLVRGFGYLLAVSAARFGIAVHGACVMSNHYHAVVTDPGGRVCAFLQHFHSLVARLCNLKLGRTENFWSTDKASLVLLPEPDDVLESLVYVLTNPVKGGLVRSHKDWPGYCTRAEDCGRAPRVWERPKLLFRGQGPLPARAELQVVVPGAFAHLSAEAFASLLGERIAAREASVQERFKAAGRRFAGASAARRQSPNATPRVKAERAGRNPTVSARRSERLVAELEALAIFRTEYREARQSWRQGEREVVYPVGTYHMLHEHRVRCHPPPLRLAS
ncbi:MAG: hypothetical protein H6744_08845 [Deltaproteobacteria bacterium]|nr:hypothetical protein [Deltaproteobacteria bacterium]MCB9786786.1 hypothetical protein [Deltaproteobacteria bacterium]